ncbi:MAG: tryptophan synthase subunit alpha [Acidobacteriota bacterium]
MSRIAETLDRLRREGQHGLIPFITAGDPDLQTTRDLLVELSRAGASVIELGVPFSDPVADGPVIQRASMRALRKGFGVSEILEAVRDVREKMNVPIVLFSYLNPLLHFGIEKLGKEARRAGVDGLLVTDLSPNESETAQDLATVLKENDLDRILLVAPTSTDQRLRMIAERASGFIYAVSRTGVTGERAEVSAEAAKLVARLRAVTDLPVAVGFGISTRDQVSEVWRFADAAVVGSAIVAEIEKLAGAANLVQLIGKFTKDLLPSQVKSSTV